MMKDEIYEDAIVVLNEAIDSVEAIDTGNAEIDWILSLALHLLREAEGKIIEGIVGE